MPHDQSSPPVNPSCWPRRGPLVSMGRIARCSRPTAPKPVRLLHLRVVARATHRGPAPFASEDDVFYVIAGTMSVLVDEMDDARRFFRADSGGVTHDFENRGEVARACSISTRRDVRGDMPDREWYRENPRKSEPSTQRKSRDCVTSCRACACDPQPLRHHVCHQSLLLQHAVNLEQPRTIGDAARPSTTRVPRR